jgi:hypothetical protein
MRAIEELAQEVRANRIGDFAHLARCWALGKGLRENAVSFARSERVRAILQKAVVPPAGAFGSGSWAEQLAETRLVLGAFSDALRNTSAFAAMHAAGLLWRLPVNINLGVVATGAAEATTVGPGDAIPARKLDVAGKTLERRKSAAIVVLSDELLREAPGEAESLISRELTKAVGAAVDRAALAVIVTAAVRNSTGDPFADARLLLEDVAPTADARLAWVLGPRAARTLATSHSGYVRAAPDLGVQGGSWLEIPAFVTDGIDTDQLTLIDGSKVAAALENAELGLSRQSLIAMEDAPAGGMSTGSPTTLTGLSTTTLVSTFQENLAAIKAVQFWGVSVLRSGAASSVDLHLGSP